MISDSTCLFHHLTADLILAHNQSVISSNIGNLEMARPRAADSSSIQPGAAAQLTAAHLLLLLCLHLSHCYRGLHLLCPSPSTTCIRRIHGGGCCCPACRSRFWTCHRLSTGRALMAIQLSHRSCLPIMQMLRSIGMACWHWQLPLWCAGRYRLLMPLLQCTRARLRCALLRQKFCRRKPRWHFGHLYRALCRRTHLRCIQLMWLLRWLPMLLISGRLLPWLLP